MACADCNIARQQPEYRVFDPKCLWCGARYFQLLRQVPPRELVDGMDTKPETKDQRTHWMTQVLDTWQKQGHDRARLRELGMAAVIPYEPVTGTAGAEGEVIAPPKPKRKASSRARAVESAGPTYEDAD